MSGEFTEGVTTPPTTNDDGAQTGEPESYLANFVGEGKTYTTVEEAAEALAKKAVHADKHIETILAEKKTVEEKLQEVSATSKSLDEVLAAINESVPPVVPPEKPEGGSTQEKLLTLDDVDSYLKQQSEATKKQEAIENTWNKLAGEGVFGDINKAKQAVALYIKEDPARKALVDAMAVTDPDNLIKILKPDSQTVTFTEGQESVKFEGLPAGKLTWAMVDKVKKENNKLFHSPAFRQRMQEELI